MTGSDFKVDFFCIGVAKAGTTTLHDLLSLQDEIRLPKRKETNFFSFGHRGKPSFTGPLDNTSVNETTITSFEEYVGDFDNDEGRLTGEICPSYVLDGCADTIFRHNPDAKIVILLREPVNRAYSNYQHLVRDGRERGSFEEALAAEEERLAKGWEWFWGLKQNSRYHDVVKQYMNIFGNDNVRVVLFEDFIKDQQTHLKQIMEFIGLDPATARFEAFDSNKSGVVSGKWRFLHQALLSEGWLNSVLRTLLPPVVRKKMGEVFKKFSTEKGQMLPETIARLREEFSDDQAQLKKLLGDKSMSAWSGQRDVS